MGVYSRKRNVPLPCKGKVHAEKEVKDMMSTQEKQNSPERIELKGFLSEFRDALEEEIDKIKKSGQSSTLLFNGRQIERHGPDLWYLFNVEYAPSIPADTPCKLVIGKDQFDVTIISFDDSSIMLSTSLPLPDTIEKARLENGATVLMERLIKCIEKNAEKENPAGNRMLPADGRVYAAKKIFEYSDLTLESGNTQKQNDAIISAISNDISYIWGPPGTGKTTVIGQIIDALYKHDRSVLVVSHTNTAVDGAIEKADKIYSKSNHSDRNYPILRLGTPVRPLPDRVLLTQHVAALGKELYEQKELLENQQTSLQRRINEIHSLIAKNTWIKESNLDAIKEALDSITAYETEISKIQDRIDAINVSVTKEKSAHPEYANYQALSKTLNAKKSDYDTTCQQIEKAKSTISVLPISIQAAQDEAKKHSKYAELREQEAKYMSTSFLRSEIDKATGQITSLQNLISDLLQQQTAAQQTISDYDKKSAVAKLFSGKNAVTQAQAALDRIQRELPNTNDDLRRQQNLKQEYSRQLENLLLLQEQIHSVIPSKTPEYWINEVNRLRAALRAAQTALSDLTDRKATLRKDICELERQQEKAKTAFNALSELEKRSRLERDNLNNFKKAHDKENRSCSELLEKESALCIAFLPDPTSENISSRFKKLSEQFKAVKSEIASIDMVAIQKEKDEADQQLIEISRQLNALKQKMQELEKQAIMNAKIVGATLAKTYLSETLRERKFDTVILDEASMASIPALWCASYLAETSIVIVGDFLQLPPIVMADAPMAQEWLGKDIFSHSGMQERARNKDTCPENFVMLNDQFRMESDIADIANMYYGAYGGLRSNDHTEFRNKAREQFYSWYSGKRTEKNVHLIDTESLHAWVTGVPQGKGHSRLNCFSAAVSVDLAFKLLENKLKGLDPATATPEKEASVLIIAPYKPHIARINQLVDLEYRNRGFKENLNFIRAGTIHSFQGSEADIVIFDLVIDEPHWKANLFMTKDNINEDLRKMFNVAVTRAKFKLFIVGNFAYCQKRAKNNALSELLDKLINKDRLIKEDAKTLLPEIVFERQSNFAFDGTLAEKHIVCREDGFNDYFMADICSFKKRLIIYSAFMTEARLSKLLPAFSDAIRARKQIIVVTKALSDRGKTELAQYQKCEEELRNIGVSVLHKKGMHEKLIFVDSDAVWIGSLNALSFSGLTGEVMQRHADHDLTSEYEKLFDIEHICGAIENTYEQKCPICGGEMIVKESDEGGIYWQCVSGDYSRKTVQPYPRDGVLRCKCGAPYAFVMKNEPRWVCTKDSRHYQKMRESDLKLEKMAALIPTKAARSQVNKYFSARKKEFEAKKKAAVPKEAATKKSTNAPINKDDPDQMRLF